MLPLIPWSHIFVHRFTTIHSRKILILLSKSVLIDYITPIYVLLFQAQGFLGGSDGKESTCNAGDLGSIPGFGRSPGEGNGNPLQYSCLEYWQDMDRGARGVQSSFHKELETTEQLTLTLSQSQAIFLEIRLTTEAKSVQNSDVLLDWKL